MAEIAPDDPIQHKHEVSSSAGADVEKALLENLQKCLRALLQLDPSLAQGDVGSGDALQLAETSSVKTIPQKVLSKYLRLLDRPVNYNEHKVMDDLLEMIDEHPRLLMEVSHANQRTFLHFAVLTNSEAQVQRLLDIMLADKDAASSNNRKNHLSKNLQYLLTIESFSGLTAYQMACIVGNDRIVRMLEYPSGEGEDEVEEDAELEEAKIEAEEEAETPEGKAKEAEDAEAEVEAETPEEKAKDAEDAEAEVEAETPEEKAKDAEDAEAEVEAETPEEKAKDAEDAEAEVEAETPEEKAKDAEDAEAEVEAETPEEKAKDADQREVRVGRIGEVLKSCLKPLRFSDERLKIMSLGDEFRLHTSLLIGDDDAWDCWVEYYQSNDLAAVLRDIISKLAEQDLLSAFLELRDNAGRHILHYLADFSLPTPFAITTKVLDLIFSTFMSELNRHISEIDMNVRDSVGRTPLHLAAAQGYLKIVEYFANDVRTDLNATFIMSSCGIDRQKGEEDSDIENISPLSLAVVHNHFQVVKILLDAPTSREFGPLNVNLKISKELRRIGTGLYYTIWSPLQFAAFLGHVETLKVLLADDRVHDSTSKDEDLEYLECARALQLATLGGKPQAVKALLKNEKIDPFALDNEGNTALHYAFFIFKEDVYGPWEFVNTSQCLFNPSAKRKMLKNIGGTIGCIDLLLQAGLDMDQQNIYGEATSVGPHTPDDVQQWWYDKVARELQVTKNNVSAATNAISVTAALVASTSFVGPLQPPLGISTNIDADNLWLLGYSQVNHAAVDVFLFFDSLSFYLAIASIMLALIPSLPIQREGIFHGVKSAQRYLQGAVVLLFASITFLICTFSAASVVIIPQARWKYKAIIVSTTIFGGFICLLVLVLFLERLCRLIWPKNRPFFAYLRAQWNQRSQNIRSKCM